jgi:prepilin-type N-terminal cleavage/methylation domain-containing protein/prepilin-type processing-associated H-X9-DG protein
MNAAEKTGKKMNLPGLNAAFTLIELLVTVAVIGVLAALLMPALSSARRKADSARCISNLRQLGIAARLYADEIDGRLPRARAFAQTGTNIAGGLPTIQQVLSPQVRGVGDVFKCPRDKGGLFERDGSSYDWNASLNGRILHRIGQDRPDESSSGTFLLRDREGWHSRGRRNAVFVDGHAGPEHQ